MIDTRMTHQIMFATPNVDPDGTLNERPIAEYFKTLKTTNLPSLETSVKNNMQSAFYSFKIKRIHW